MVEVGGLKPLIYSMSTSNTLWVPAVTTTAANDLIYHFIFTSTRIYTFIAYIHLHSIVGIYEIQGQVDWTPENYCMSSKDGWSHGHSVSQH